MYGTPFFLAVSIGLVLWLLYSFKRHSQVQGYPAGCGLQSAFRSLFNRLEDNDKSVSIVIEPCHFVSVLQVFKPGQNLNKYTFHLCVYPGFTEENVDEIKETLVGSNLYLLVLTAVITALQVRAKTYHNIHIIHPSLNM